MPIPLIESLQHHTAFRGDPGGASLFRYDRRFSDELRMLAFRALEHWNEAKSTRSVVTLLSNWPQLERIHSDTSIFDLRLQSPVHGDTNRANVLISTNGAVGTVQLID